MAQFGKWQGLLFCVTLLLLQTNPSQCLVPATFSCGATAPVGISTLSLATDNAIKIDLTHAYCGQIEVSRAASGFHSRPGDWDPLSASIHNTLDPYVYHTIIMTLALWTVLLSTTVIFIDG